MGLGLCFLRGVGALTFPSMAGSVPGTGGCDSEQGTHGTRWWHQLSTGGRNLSLPAWLPGGSQETPTVSVAVCYGELSKLSLSSHFPPV